MMINVTVRSSYVPDTQFLDWLGESRGPAGMALAKCIRNASLNDRTFTLEAFFDAWSLPRYRLLLRSLLNQLPSDAHAACDVHAETKELCLLLDEHPSRRKNLPEPSVALSRYVLACVLHGYAVQLATADGTACMTKPTSRVRDLLLAARVTEQEMNAVFAALRPLVAD